LKKHFLAYHRAMETIYLGVDRVGYEELLGLCLSAEAED
jgi:hypothetical protein